MHAYVCEGEDIIQQSEQISNVKMKYDNPHHSQNDKFIFGAKKDEQVAQAELIMRSEAPL